MKPQDIFAVAVRIAGLVVFLYGLGRLLYGVLGAMGMFETTAVRYNAVFGVCEIVAGLFMMRGMTPLVDIAFPPDASSSDEQQPADAREKEADDTVA
jgi:hypothetical protein